MQELCTHVYLHLKRCEHGLASQVFVIEINWLNKKFYHQRKYITDNIHAWWIHCFDMIFMPDPLSPDYTAWPSIQRQQTHLWWQRHPQTVRILHSAIGCDTLRQYSRISGLWNASKAPASAKVTCQAEFTTCNPYACEENMHKPMVCLILQQTGQSINKLGSRNSKDQVLVHLH